MADDKDKITPIRPMTQDEAFARAREELGERSLAGRNFNYSQKSYHVGVKGLMGVWARRGVGSNFEEAFDSIEDFPDGDAIIHQSMVRELVRKRNFISKTVLTFASKDEEPSISELPSIVEAQRAEKIVAITPFGREIVIKNRKGEK